MEIFLGLNQLFIRAMTLRTVENKIDVGVVWHQKPENEKRCKIKCQLQNKTKQGTEKNKTTTYDYPFVCIKTQDEF